MPGGNSWLKAEVIDLRTENDGNETPLMLLVSLRSRGRLVWSDRIPDSGMSIALLDNALTLQSASFPLRGCQLLGLNIRYYCATPVIILFWLCDYYYY